jgi:hypothetical protein
VDKPTISLGTSICAFLVSLASIWLSISNYRKDRWKLSIEAKIQLLRIPEGAQSDSNPGRLLVTAANIGRRALTIENIDIQVFEDEIEGFQGTAVEIRKMDRVGYVAVSFFKTPKDFPKQLKENDPLKVEIFLVGFDRAKAKDRRRLCIVQIVGRRKPALVRCRLPGDHDSRPTYFSGS